MFSSSVRRAALVAPQTPIAASLSTAAPRTAASQALSFRSPQRRLSSSKPSSPANGSKGVAEGQEVPATPARARPDGEKKSSSRTGKRKAKDVVANTGKGRYEAVQNLPSVPSTQHIAPAQICASSFFSLHRPISLHMNFPKTVTDDAFAAIFSPRMKTNAKPSEVISTLSTTLESLDAATANMKQLNLGGSQWNAETDELRAAITAESYRKAETHHLDNPPAEESAMNISQHILSGRYQPFSPPPPPVPMNTAESLAAGMEAADIQEPLHRTYTAVLTIEESTDEHGEVTYMAHSSPLMQEESPAPTRFLERMSIRQEQYRERAEENGMWAISVKRQRKLKMKKHKYKKLMRRTRNLRRRLDRN